MTWQLASNESSDLYGPQKVVGIVPRDGFETSFALEYPARFVRAAALDAEWNVLGSSGIVDTNGTVVFADVPPVTQVKHTGNIVITDSEDGYALSVTHSTFPIQGKLFGFPVGWHMVLGVFLLGGLWAAARYF